MRVSGFQNIPGAPGNLLADFNFLAQNQGPSTPVRYYPDANNEKGGFLPDFGAGRINNVRYKKDPFEGYRTPTTPMVSNPQGDPGLLAQIPPNVGASSLGDPNAFWIRPRIGYDQQGLDVGGSLNLPIDQFGNIQVTGGYRPDSSTLDVRGSVGQPPGAPGLGVDFFINRKLNQKNPNDLGGQLRYEGRF